MKEDLNDLFRVISFLKVDQINTGSEESNFAVVMLSLHIMHLYLISKRIKIKYDTMSI